MGILLFSTGSRGASIPSGAKNASFIAGQKFLQTGSGTKKLVSDPDYGKIMECSITPQGTAQRAEVVLHSAGEGKHMHYEFLAKYIKGKGALINQWHQPIGDGLGPAACFMVRYGMYHIAYFKNKERTSAQLIPLDNKWHKFELDACFSHGGNGYLHVYVDDKYYWSSYGDNSKAGGHGGQFKLGVYAADNDLTMQYAWALWKGNSGAVPKPTETPLGVEGLPKDTTGTGGGLKVVKATASAIDKDNVPANAIDKDLITRWSAAGETQWLLLDLGAKKKITGISIAWFGGDRRIDYYDVHVSDDGSTFTPVLEGGFTDGKTLLPQPVKMDPVSARYVRITGNGNNSGGEVIWNSITEVIIYGEGGSPTLVPRHVRRARPADLDHGTALQFRVVDPRGRSGITLPSPASASRPAAGMYLVLPRDNERGTARPAIPSK